MINQSPFPRVAFAIILFASGFFAHELLVPSANHPPPVTAQDSLQTAPNLDALNNELARLQSEIATLQSQLEEQSIVARIESPKAIETRAKGVASAMPFSDERFKEMMRKQVDRQLDIYAARLNLNDDQRSRLEEIMLLRFTQMGERMGRGPHVQADANDSPFITQRDIDDLFSEILSFEQLEEYDEMRAQEIASRSEMMATAQLSQIAPQLGLSEEQKNRVYGIYYNLSFDMTSDFADPQHMGNSRNQANEQISEILDDQQKAIFEKLNESQFPGNFTIIAR